MEELVRTLAKKIDSMDSDEFLIALRQAILVLNDVIERKQWPDRPTTAELRRQEKQRQRRGGI